MIYYWPFTTKELVALKRAFFEREGSKIMISACSCTNLDRLGWNLAQLTRQGVSFTNVHKITNCWANSANYSLIRNAELYNSCNSTISSNRTTIQNKEQGSYLVAFTCDIHCKSKFSCLVLYLSYLVTLPVIHPRI